MAGHGGAALRRRDSRQNFFDTLPALDPFRSRVLSSWLLSYEKEDAVVGSVGEPSNSAVTSISLRRSQSPKENHHSSSSPLANKKIFACDFSSSPIVKACLRSRLS